jgi:hypothetical protein
MLHQKMFYDLHELLLCNFDWLQKSIWLHYIIVITYPKFYIFDVF